MFSFKVYDLPCYDGYPQYKGKKWWNSLSYGFEYDL